MTVTSPTHGSKHSLHVAGPAIANYAAYQDLPAKAIAPNTNVVFAGWVYPVSGTQEQENRHPWVERDSGATWIRLSESLTNGTVEADAWGKSVVVSDALTPAWHHIVLSANAKKHTATLRIDGRLLATTPPGAPFPAAEDATVWIGQGFYGDAYPSDFYYDGLVATG